MDAIFKKADIMLEFQKNKAEIWRRYQDWGPFLHIHSVETVGRSSKYEYYDVSIDQEHIWKKHEDDLFVLGFVKFEKPDNGFEHFRCRIDKLKQHADCGTFDVDALDIEKLNTETDTWSWLIAR